jgi:hypothetical protein
VWIKKREVMKRLKLIFPVVMIILLSVSCVTGKRYNTLNDKSLMLLSERDSLKAENIWLTMSNRELTTRSMQLTDDADRLTEELGEARTELTQRREELGSL